MHRLTRLVLRAPLASALLLLALTVFWIAGLSGVRREFGYRTLLGADFPPIATLEAFVERYGGGFPIYVVWRCGDEQPCRSVFDETSLRLARTLELELRTAAGVRDLHSPSSASLALATPNGFEVRRFFENGVLAPDAARLATRALDDPLWVGHLVSADGVVGALVVLLEDTRSDTMEGVVDAVEASLEPFRAQGFEFHLGGHPVASVVAGRELAQSTASLVPFTAIVIALVIFSLTRSLQATLVTMLTMGVGLLWTFGFLGWLRWPQDSLLQVLAPLVLIVGVSDAVHVLSRYASAIGAGRSRSDKVAAILTATQEIGTPCVLTTVTTAAAFLSFLTSDLITFVRFGAVCAFGVCACLLLTFALLPLLVVVLPLRPTTPPRVAESWRIVSDAILRTARQRSIPILLAAGAVGVLFSIGWIGYLRVDTDPEEMFGSQNRVTRWDRFIGAHLHGTDSLELNIALPAESPLSDPSTQEQLTRLAAFLRGTGGLGPTTSVQDLMGRLNRVLHDDDPAFERPADSAAGNAEILELLAMDDRETLEAWTTLDGSELRLSAEGQADTSMTRGQVLAAVREYVEAELPASWSVSLTGPFALSFDWVNALQSTQLRSFATAFLLVLAFMAVFLRSIPLGIAAMVPALLPVVLTLGLMGFAGMSLDVGRVMIAAIVIGIAVDDAVHLLGRYRKERASGRLPADAISASLLFVVRPVVVTSLSLALGFLTLTTSAWQTISSFGFLVSLSILSALVATLFVLPALFFAVDRRRDPEAADAEPPEASSSQSRKLLTSLLVVIPPAAAIGLIAVDIAGDPPPREIPCLVLPNGRILPSVGPGCPLLPNDEIRSIEASNRLYTPLERSSPVRAPLLEAGTELRVGVVRSGFERWEPLPVIPVSTRTRLTRAISGLVLAAAMLAVPWLVLWRSSAKAAPPLAFLYSSISAMAMTLISRPTSPAPWLLACAAAVASPAVLVHLAMTLPKERKVLRDIPGMKALPYLASLPLLAVGWLALDHNSVLWPTFLYLLGALALGAWLVLCTSCAFALRESQLPLERGRARVLLYGTLLLPIVPTVAGVTGGGWRALPTYLAAAAILTPMPIGLAISRYNLFDLGDDVRAAVAHLLYAALGALILTSVLVLSPIASWNDVSTYFALCLVCVVAIDQLRPHALGFLESVLSPRVRELRELEDVYARDMSQLLEEDRVAEVFGRAIEKAISPRAVAVFLTQAERWRPGFSSGEPPLASQLADCSASLLTQRESLDVVQIEASASPQGAILRGNGVEFVLALRRAEQLVGILLVAGSKPGRPYGAHERGFAVRLGRQASLAIANARLASELVAKERQVATGRIALTLLHEVRKSLDWIAALSRAMEDRSTLDPSSHRDLHDIRELCWDSIGSLETLVRKGAPEILDGAGRPALTQVIDHSVRAVERRFGCGRIYQAIDPRGRRLPVPEALGHALVNLLENALLASSDRGRVHLSATQTRGWVRITIADCGAGMDAETVARCFDPGFSTRKDRSGLGVGLSLSRQLITSFGGCMEIESQPGQGTRVSLRLPADGSETPAD